MTGSEFDRCFEMYKETVWSAAYCCVKNSSDADDICQDVFLKLYTYNETLTSEEHIKAWLLRCTINRSRDLLRSHWHRFSRPLDDVSAAEPVNTVNSDTDLSGLFMKLSRKNRTALYLHYYQGFSVEETAKLLDITASAAGVRIMRGKRQLKKLLEEEIKEYSDGLQRNC